MILSGPIPILIASSTASVYGLGFQLVLFLHLVAQDPLETLLELDHPAHGLELLLLGLRLKGLLLLIGIGIHFGLLVLVFVRFLQIEGFLFSNVFILGPHLRLVP